MMNIVTCFSNELKYKYSMMMKKIILFCVFTKPFTLNIFRICRKNFKLLNKHDAVEQFF